MTGRITTLLFPSRLLSAWVRLCLCFHVIGALHVFLCLWKAVIRHSSPTVPSPPPPYTAFLAQLPLATRSHDPPAVVPSLHFQLGLSVLWKAEACSLALSGRLPLSIDGSSVEMWPGPHPGSLGRKFPNGQIIAERRDQLEALFLFFSWDKWRISFRLNIK